MKPSGIILENIDPGVRPQDDLFRYVNGSWMKNASIPEDRPSQGAFYELSEKAEQAVKEIIEDAAKNPSTDKKHKVADFYKAFMDEDIVEERGLSPVIPILSRILEVRSISDLVTLMAEISMEGYPGLWGADVSIDAGEPTRNLLHIYQSGLGLPDESYYRESEHAATKKEYTSYLQRIIDLVINTEVCYKIFGNLSSTDSAKEITALETRIAAHHWDKVTLRDPQKTYNLARYTDAIALNPQLVNYFAVLDIKPELLEYVVIYTPDFFAGMVSLFEEVPLNLWKKWLTLRTINSVCPLLSKKFVDEHFAFYGKTLTGTPMLRPRWKRAINALENALGEIVGQLYVARYFPESSKMKIRTLVGNLIEAYRCNIEGLSWLGQETKAKALEKLTQFTPKIGYPDKWIDYSSVEIDAQDLYGNVKRAALFDFYLNVDKLGKPVDKKLWHMTPQTVNAYYDPTQNEIVFPAAILQPPFFSPEADDAVNYGGIGAVIGHEIGHGFDDQGSHFDGEGRLKNWWTDKDRDTFEKLTARLVSQYDTLIPEAVPGQHVNGALTLGENIGDLGGLAIAYQAYMISLNGSTPSEIDGFSGFQRFFMNWGAIWRQVIRPEMAAQLLSVDPHSPNEFRCNAVIANMEEFYEAFGVREGDALWLLPSKRTRIW